MSAINRVGSRRVSTWPRIFRRVVLASLVLLPSNAAIADTLELHVFPYCEPGTVCGHADQATLDRYVCDAVQETNLQWEVTGLSFRPTTKPVDGNNPNPAPMHCIDGDDAGTLCVDDDDCGGGGTCENLPADKDKYYEVLACDTSPAGRALRAQWFKDFAVFESNAISLFATRKREWCCSGIATTNQDPGKLLGFYCSANPNETSFFSGSAWAHELGHYWSLVHTFCGGGDPADNGGNAPFHDCDTSTAGGTACEGGVDWGKECTSDQDCASPGVCALDQLPLVNDTPPDPKLFERLRRACSDAESVKKCSVDADCGPDEGTCSVCREFVCSDDHDLDCATNADCDDAGAGTCVCIPGKDEDLDGAIIDGHEWVSGISSLYGLDTFEGVDVGSPHAAYCSGAWRQFFDGQTSEEPDDLTDLLSNAMSYYGCHGPYVRNGNLVPAFMPNQVARIQAARSLVISRSPLFLSDVCAGAGKGGDADHDGICGDDDSCPVATSCSSGMNTCQRDADLDGQGDACDLCPSMVGQTGDLDDDCIGDICDPDVDGDGCLNDADQHPTTKMMPVGSKFNETCGFGTETVYGDEGDDSDNDGFPNCADRDDDNDGACDDAITVTATGGVPENCEPQPATCDVPLTGCVGPDACPETAGMFGCQIQGAPNDCQPDWFVCAFGACNEFFAKIASIIDPDPTRDLVFDPIQMVNRSIYVAPLAGKTLSQTAKAIQTAAGQAAGGLAVGAAAPITGGTADKLRVEIWSKRSNTRVAIVGEFSASQIQFSGDPTRGAFLALTPGSSPAGTPVIEVRATWGIGTEAGDRVRDRDDDRTPDAFDNCILQANPLGRDADSDGYGNACDADLDGDLRVSQLDVDAVRACEGADLTLRQPLLEPDESSEVTLTAVFTQRPDPEAVLLARLCVAADLNDDDHVDAADIALAARALGGTPGPSGVVGKSVPLPLPAAELAPVCSRGVPILEPIITLTDVDAGSGGKGMTVRGRLPVSFAELDPMSTGAQVLVEDLGRGGRPLLRLTHQALQIPPGEVGCDPEEDGWKKSPTGGRFVYRNGSALLDPPACTHGSERGALYLGLEDREGQAAFRFRTRSASLETPVGPLRLTVVPGGEAQSVAGACGVFEFAAARCGFNAGRTQFTCR